MQVRVFFPTDSIGIIVLCNQNGSPIPSIVRNTIADRMLGLKYHDWQTDLKRNADSAKVKAKNTEKNQVSMQKTNTKPSHDLRNYEGTYAHPGYGSFDITLKKDSLFIITPTLTFWLRHYHYDVFVALQKDAKEGIDTSEQNTKVQFNTNLTGDIESASINLEPSIKPIVFTRGAKAKEITKDSLQSYIGEYEISGVTIKIYTKEAATLYMFVQGQPEYELLPIDKDKFNLKNVSGFSVQFNRNDKDEVIELLSIQPNGTFKATKKK